MKLLVNSVACLVAGLMFGAGMAQASPTVIFQPTTYSKIEGWSGDDHEAALKTLLVSCTRMVEKPTTVPETERPKWHQTCREAMAVSAKKKSKAREFFESHFAPYFITTPDKSDGLLTGYYEPELRASPTPDSRYKTPLYSLPPDLVTAHLGNFFEDQKGKILSGRLQGNRLVPYLDRAEIKAGGLANRQLELLWVDDPIGAFFLEIQGSGRVVLPDGKVRRVGYAGKNGHAYTAIGRVLVDRGEIPQAEISLFTIRDWMKANPSRADELMNQNRSFVFFRMLDSDGPFGSEGTVLTPGRSLAVDRSVIPMGTPIFVQGVLPEDGGPFRRLMIAQDTGGAITGPMRGDVFWGPGEEAEFFAGHMKDRAAFYLLWPKGLTPQAKH